MIPFAIFQNKIKIAVKLNSNYPYYGVFALHTGNFSKTRLKIQCARKKRKKTFKLNNIHMN